MFEFLRKMALWVLLCPLALNVLGTASNQAVLYANNDKFPVMWNDYKVTEYALRLKKAAASDDENVAAKAALDTEALIDEGFIDDTHCIMTSKTHFNLLADIIDLNTETISIGDVLLRLSEYLWMFAPCVWGTILIRKLYVE